MKWRKEITIEELIDQHEVIFNIFLGNLSEVALHDFHHFEQELEDHGGVDILLGNGRQPDVGPLDVHEAGAGDVGHRWPHLLSCMDDIHAECIHCIPPASY